MSTIRTLSFGSIFAVLLATGGYAAEQGYSPNSSQQDYSAAPYARIHAHFRRYGMTRELKVLWRTEMPKGHRGAQLRSAWAAMTDAEKAAKVAELRAKWTSLDPRVRDAILVKLEHKKANEGKRGGRMRGDMQAPTPAEAASGGLPPR